MTVNGSKFKNFHKYCDNKGPTLTIIETKDNFIFGGFTPLNWNSNGNESDFYDYSKKTFLFSMNLLKKYNMFNKQKFAIINSYNYDGPSFGNQDIYFEYTLLEGKVSAHDDSNFFEHLNLELTQGKGESEPFDTKEIEIFKVVYE